MSLVIPCYNEGESLPQLGELLRPELEKLRLRFQVSLLFVDDGSSDDTFPRLEALAANLGEAKVLRHERNRGLGAALRTGIEGSGEADFVAFLDSDATYPPSLLEPLLNAVEAGACLATVSPYHPAGGVEGVPAWRLLLSRGLSLLLGLLSHSGLHTYTAMVRAMPLALARKHAGKNDSFIFVTEMLLSVLVAGGDVREVPAVLRTRRFGQSKMRVARTVLGQLRLVMVWAPRLLRRPA